MENASDIILKALNEADEIKAAGKHSLLAQAARALDPAAPANLPGISSALGLHPGLIIPLMVTADMAGDNISRKDMANVLIPQLRYRSQPPTLSPQGQIRLAAWCLEQLEPLRPRLEGLLEKLLPVARAAAAGEAVDALALKEASELATELQRTKVMQMEMGVKSKLGVPDAEAMRRRAAQAARAFIKGLQDNETSGPLLPTVAGETAGAIGTLSGTQEALRFCLELAKQVEELPEQDAARPLPS